MHGKTCTVIFCTESRKIGNLKNWPKRNPLAPPDLRTADCCQGKCATIPSWIMPWFVLFNSH